MIVSICFFISVIKARFHKCYLLDRGLEGSAAIVGSPVALVTVENVMLERRGLEAWNIFEKK